MLKSRDLHLERQKTIEIGGFWRPWEEQRKQKGFEMGST